MKCPDCGEEMKEGFLYGSKDGAFSFSEEIPGIFSNAKNAKGFVAITKLESGKRIHIQAAVCEKCRKIVASY